MYGRVLTVGLCMVGFYPAGLCPFTVFCRGFVPHSRHVPTASRVLSDQHLQLSALISVRISFPRTFHSTLCHCLISDELTTKKKELQEYKEDLDRQKDERNILQVSVYQVIFNSD